jgi:hypothetical protein
MNGNYFCQSLLEETLPYVSIAIVAKTQLYFNIFPVDPKSCVRKKTGKTYLDTYCPFKPSILNILLKSRLIERIIRSFASPKKLYD